MRFLIVKTIFSIPAATRRGRYTNEFKADNIRAARALQGNTTNIKPEEKDWTKKKLEIPAGNESSRSNSPGENQVTSTTDIASEFFYFNFNYFNVILCLSLVNIFFLY